ncbi:MULTISPECIES: type II toxin-antitoxin system RelE/ParE family toxin [Actinotignum]|uniref:Type II toxin-antitoxin system RelE/ParE family toxin n=1 Tax=Actinotignum timonense TaxID=1870995 RepID=A0ABU5GEL3_9ACTO|nr:MULTISPECIES: type II toxin-antitoxin system RelE/ParE family toxin [Actinotignum]MBS5749359.1 type II toxin-antitoxin system RelE/ParE family toxin [Actinotignum schaalii]MDE1557852.1 type II toxin-antitoxin system RelE/ParE family toxin [Actinotignum schaalii]MDE1663231.1 type II toxin-antitoxin system RelE/ParE family toxin [Actinotignum schaalii]MDK6373723.1 type II toxin-antitoxin system RelE/ParE family toxin [Actinotignum timonense]MDK6418896.1 type II toxin-antitoxin system RelE/Par
MRVRDPDLYAFFLGGPYPRRYPAGLQKQLTRRLQMLNAARTVHDLRQPPGNRLEALSGNLRGYWSIRVNNQWRVVFRWDNEAQEAYDVHFRDYH